MNILWLANVLPPLAAAAAGLEPTQGGGWLTGQLVELEKQPDIFLTYLAPHPGAKQVMRFRTGNVDYVVFPEKPAAYPVLFSTLLTETTPDLLHIHGTEFPHALAMLDAFDPARTLVSIQGLTEQYALCYYADMPERYRHASPFKRLASALSPVGGAVIALGQAAMEQAGKLEHQVLQRICHVAGRTHWDKENTLAVNPALCYHHVGELLRSDFYRSTRWQLADCRRHTIFYSQATYPIKGLHLLLEQMPVILERFPDTTIVVAGRAPYRLKNPLVQAATDYLFEYQAYLKKRIHALKLEEHIQFTGPMDSAHMRSAYLNAHVFVSASSIENSPNSLGEAMMLGLPCVSSDVGGVSSMLKHEKEGLLFPFEEPQIMTQHILQVFEDDALAAQLGQGAAERAARTHDPQTVTDQLLSAYRSIVELKPVK